MTKADFNSLRTKHEHLSNGQFLTFIAYTILSNMELTILQETAKANINSMGTFNPSDSKLYINALEILQLATEEKADAIITMLKRLPPLDIGASNVKYYINDIECMQGDYLNSDTYIGIRRDTSIFTDNDTPSEKLLYDIMQNSDIKRWLEFEAKLIKEGVESKYPYYNPNFKPQLKDYSHIDMTELYKQMAIETKHKKSEFLNPTRAIREGSSMHNLFGASPLPTPKAKEPMTEVFTEDDSLLEDEDFDGRNHDFITRPHRG